MYLEKKRGKQTLMSQFQQDFCYRRITIYVPAPRTRDFWHVTLKDFGMCDTTDSVPDGKGFFGQYLESMPTQHCKESG